jgi:hypothetical protein
MNEVKLCKDCKHCIPVHYPHWKHRFSKCKAVHDYINTVSGDVTYQYCSIVRRSTGRCGTQATLFEQKVSLYGKIKAYFKGETNGTN